MRYSTAVHHRVYGIFLGISLHRSFLDDEDDDDDKDKDDGRRRRRRRVVVTWEDERTCR